MDDNETLDWGVGDQDDFDDAGENYQEPQNEQARFDAEDNEDTISLGEDDDDQLLSYRNTGLDMVNSRTNLSQELENRHISSVPKEPKEVGANRDTSTRVPAERDTADSYDSRGRQRQERQDSPPRRRGRRDDRSPRTPQHSANARVTHALPPKPVGSVVSLPPPSRVLVAEPTTISPRAGGRDLKKQNDSGRPHSLSPVSPPNRESRTRSNNGENNQPTTSKPADPTWQHPDSLPPRTNRALATDNAHEKDAVQRSRPPAVDPTGLSFEDRHYRPGSDLPPANSSSRPSERSRPEPVPDRYSRSRHDRADSPPRDRARPRSPSVPDSRAQGYADRHFMSSSYEPAPQDYRPDSRRRPGPRPDDHADVKSKIESDRPSLRRRESSRGPRDRNPPRQSDMREPPVASLSTSRPRSPPRTRDSNHRQEENSGNRERRGWPEGPAPSNYPNRSDRRSPFDQQRTRLIPTLPANYDEYYDRYPDYDPRLDPSVYPQDRELVSARRERPNDPDYSRYPRSQPPPPPERLSRPHDYDRRSPPEEKSTHQALSKTRSPLPPQTISFQSRGKRDAPAPNNSNPTPVSSGLPRKPDPVSEEPRSRSGYTDPTTAPESSRPEQSPSHSHLPPIDTRMDVDSRDGPPSSNRSGSRYQPGDERQTGRRSRSPNNRRGPSPLNGPPSARLGADSIPSGPRHREQNRGVDNVRVSDRRQPEPQRRRDERDPPRGNDWGRRDHPPHSNPHPTGPKPVTGTNSIPVNLNSRRPPPSGPAGGPTTPVSRAAEPSSQPAPVAQAQPVQQVPPPFMNALPPASALLDPSKFPKPRNAVGHQVQPDSKALDMPLDQERVQPTPNIPTQPREPRRRSRFDQPIQHPQQAPSQDSVESRDKYQRATPPPMSREPSISMKSKSSSERLSDVVGQPPLEERVEIQAPEGTISLIDRFSDDISRPMERVDRDGRRPRFGEPASPPLSAALPAAHGARNFNLPPRPQTNPEIHSQQTQRPINGHMNDAHDPDIRMHSAHDKLSQPDDRDFQGAPSKVSLLERLSSAENVHEPQSLRERIVPSKRDRDEMAGRDRPEGRDAPYDIDDGMDPKRQRRRGGGKPRRSNTGGGRR